AYLNLDRVIEIIRTEDEPKQALMAENWATEGGTARLSDVQAEAILNMRLRALRRLEEMAIREERERLLAEQGALRDLVASEEAQWKKVADEIRAIAAEFGAPKGLAGLTDAADLAEKKRATTPWPTGARRTGFAAPPDLAEDAAETLVEREPITVVCSEQGWIRALTGHRDASQPVKFKDGDGPRFHLSAMTTDRLLIFASDGRVFTLACDRLPGGRGMGEPVRLLAEMAQDAEIVTIVLHQPGTRLVVASTAGDGFLLPADDAVAQTRGGRQVLNLRDEARLAVAVPVGDADHLAVVGQNRKMLIFALSELNEMTRGKGVRLQKYKDGGLSDLKPFRREDGLSWPMGSKTRTLRPEEMAEWVGPRASAGRMAPRGFPQSNRFA
ncbi:MAG: DNA gyrase C-terminal beta-propeller domain-containing protein, partial [Pseudomonadota bacterium]